MSLSAIKSSYNSIYQSIFTINPVFSYKELAEKFTELANLINAYEGDNDDWLYEGEGNECQLSDMLVGAYWHYTNWHSGQDSDSYAALCALGEVYQPNMAQPPAEEPEEDEDEFPDMETSCFRMLNQMAENVALLERQLKE